MGIVENWTILGGLCSHKFHLMEKGEGIMPEGKPVDGGPGERRPRSSARSQQGVPLHHPHLQQHPLLGPSSQLLLSRQFDLRCFEIVHAAPGKLLRG